MKRFILERRTTQIERIVVRAESWDDAKAILKDRHTRFTTCPDKAVAESIEFIGNIDDQNT